MKRRHSQITEVEKLKDEIKAAEENLIRLRKTLTVKVSELQSICTHDEFHADDNGDNHKPGYYYVCTDCKLFLTRKPANAVIIYPRA